MVSIGREGNLRHRRSRQRETGRLRLADALTVSESASHQMADRNLKNSPRPPGSMAKFWLRFWCPLTRRTSPPVAPMLQSETAMRPSPGSNVVPKMTRRPSGVQAGVPCGPCGLPDVVNCVGGRRAVVSGVAYE